MCGCGDSLSSGRSILNSGLLLGEVLSQPTVDGVMTSTAQQSWSCRPMQYINGLTRFWLEPDQRRQNAELYRNGLSPNSVADLMANLRKTGALRRSSRSKRRPRTMR